LHALPQGLFGVVGGTHQSDFSKFTESRTLSYGDPSEHFTAEFTALAIERWL
jgi:hypothetical protein